MSPAPSSIARASPKLPLLSGTFFRSVRSHASKVILRSPTTASKRSLCSWPDPAPVTIVSGGEKDKAAALEVFARCDLDASGTLNSNEEAKQLLTFTVYKLQDVVGAVASEGLESKAKELIDTELESNPMDFEAFWDWFVENFGEKEGLFVNVTYGSP